MTQARYRLYTVAITASSLAATVGILDADKAWVRLAFLASHGLVTIGLLMMVRREPEDGKAGSRD